MEKRAVKPLAMTPSGEGYRTDFRTMNSSGTDIDHQEKYNRTAHKY